MNKNLNVKVAFSTTQVFKLGRHFSTQCWTFYPKVSILFFEDTSGDLGSDILDPSSNNSVNCDFAKVKVCKHVI